MTFRGWPRSILVTMSPSCSPLVHRARGAAVAAAASLLLSSIVVPAGADEDGRIGIFGHHYSLIAGASMFLPREAATRSIYGERTFAPVVALWSFNTPSGLGLAWDFGAQRIRQDGPRADLARAGVGPRFLFADGRADVAPYVTVRGDVFVARLDRGAAWRTKPGANIELGASVLRHLVISGRYDALPRIDGVQLSGFSARLAVKVL